MKFLHSRILNMIPGIYLNEIRQTFQITEESFKIQTDQINNVKDILKKSVEPKSKSVMLDFYDKSIIFIQYIENLDEFNEKLDSEQLIDDYELFLKNFKNKIDRGVQNVRFRNFNVNIINTFDILNNSPLRINNLLKTAGRLFFNNIEQKRERQKNLSKRYGIVRVVDTIRQKKQSVDEYERRIISKITYNA